MRILVVSHSCSTPINQQIHAEIQKLTGWTFTLLIPKAWKDEFGNRLAAWLLPGFSAELVISPVFGNGNIILHAYRSQLKRLLKERPFDAIYVNHEPYGVATAQVCLTNRMTQQVPFGFYSCQNLCKHYPPPFRWMEQWVYRSSNFAFPITNEVGGILRRKGYRGAMTVAPLPVDPALYRPRNRVESPACLQRQPGEVLIGYVGRMVEAKGLRTLADALSRLPSHKWKLVVIGSGPFEKEFDELAAAAGISDRVLRLGFVPHEETPRYLAAFDVLVVPSETQPNWKEQFGRVIVESLACGTPVIGSDSGEIPRLIHASSGGLVFPERNAGALSGALEKMIHDEELRRSCAEKGRRWVLENISTAAVAKTMASTIEEAVRRSQRSTGTEGSRK